ncbi:hypothetical protein N566_23950 [Streptomycetaceae bacterium MP113-05]|nr:hypothetical protein N566_23950 [Streptomycetaceae bacterium MP113-05]
MLLAVAGAFSLCAGAWVGATGLAERGTSASVTPPDLHGVVDTAARAVNPWQERAWWAVAAVLAVLAVALVLSLRWLLAQTPRRSPRVLPLPGVGLATQSRALARAAAAEAETVPGVAHARVRLARRRRGRVRARVLITLAPHADPSLVLQRLARGAVHGVRVGSGATRLDCAVRLRLPSHGPRRAR